MVIRPDGCERSSLQPQCNLAHTCLADIALICDLEDTDKLDAYFGAFLLAPKQPLGEQREEDWTIKAISSKASQQRNGVHAESAPANGAAVL